jgi:ribose transport system ATP-binding protein
LGDEALRVQHLSTPNKVRDVGFSVRTGEILGIAGIVGAGRSEIIRAIFGAEPDVTGQIEIGGHPVRVRSPQEAIKHGLALIPEDRRQEGLITGFTVRVNIGLPWLQAKGGALIDAAQEKVRAEEAREQLSIKTPSVEQVVGNLSGGNQQKVVIGKWLGVEARVLFFDEPTRGIDVGAKAEVQQLIYDFAARGKAIVIVSSELSELLACCDRILVIYDGKVVSELPGDEATEEDVVYSATTGLRRALT